MPILELAVHIAGPLVISIAVLASTYWAMNFQKSKKSSTYKKINVFLLDAERGLAEQGYLWLSILIPVLYFFSFGLLAWTGYSLQLNSDGFSEFIRISTLPLALLSLSVPLTVLVARIHATHQTSLQIATAQHKNNIDTYYAHRKAMFEYFSSLKKITYPGSIIGDFHAHPRLHLRFFLDKGPTNGTPEINNEKFKESVSIISEIQEYIHRALSSNAEPIKRIEDYARASTQIFKLAETLNLPCIYENLKSAVPKLVICTDSSAAEESDLTFHVLGKGNTDQLIGSYRYTRSFLRVLCEFAGYDVSFFDKKQYPVIDKGTSYKSDQYSSEDINKTLEKAIATSRKLKTDRITREAESTNSSCTPHQ
ncbi:hypothetical protein NQ186_10065 [Pseudomonas zeae]|uniref:hypothetical protein n=1 Tax=Pseudomonas zeae TaxID=2745510 RepID=UPI002147CF25|nr:hypothetical protein [Pseudomonas zeae]UUT14509.1 hypothetical protein NQ186_10065 [Pseudomonas zeae]